MGGVCGEECAKSSAHGKEEGRGHISCDDGAESFGFRAAPQSKEGQPMPGHRKSDKRGAYLCEHPVVAPIFTEDLAHEGEDNAGILQINPRELARAQNSPVPQPMSRSRPVPSRWNRATRSAKNASG